MKINDYIDLSCWTVLPAMVLNLWVQTYIGAWLDRRKSGSYQHTNTWDAGIRGVTEKGVLGGGG